MKTNAKRLAQRVHAKRRAEERYGLVVNKDTRRKLLECIWNGRTTFVMKQSLRVSVFDVEFEGETYRVVYDKIRKEIVTFLDRDMNPEDKRTSYQDRRLDGSTG